MVSLVIAMVAGMETELCHAQQPDTQVLPPPGPPPPVAFQNLIPLDQLGFLNGYAGKPARDLIRDKQFRALAKRVFPAKTYHYGYDQSMTDAVGEVISEGKSIPVEIHDSRFVWVMGRYQKLNGRVLLWIDMRTGVFLGVFYFHPINGEPTPTLTVFSRQIHQEELAMSQLPPPFADDLSRWTEDSGIAVVTPRYFIPDNGKKYVLLHDEDYCGHPPDEPAPSADMCDGMNASAADADMNAAYFMNLSNNAANATAWLLSPEQTAWIGFRESSCGARLACRIRVTRQRTRTLMVRR